MGPAHMQAGTDTIHSFLGPRPRACRMMQASRTTRAREEAPCMAWSLDRRVLSSTLRIGNRPALATSDSLHNVGRRHLILLTYIMV
jgi:hypothetical protein